jgi:hypothetical protein
LVLLVELWLWFRSCKFSEKFSCAVAHKLRGRSSQSLRLSGYNETHTKNSFING